MDYQKLYRRIFSRLNRGQLMTDIAELTRTELPQTYTAKHRAAGLAEELLRRAGIADVERMEFPMDGESSHQDKFMPLAWEASVGKLTVLKSPVAFDDPVLADYQRHPFHLIQGSPALKEGGEIFRIMTLEQLCHGSDPEHALVLLPSDARSYGPELKTALDLGASGVICEYLRGRTLTPDAVGWVNGNTASTRWNLTKMDTPYLGFSISPRTGDKLRAALRQGEVVVRAECDGRNFEGVLPAVTARIPGRTEEEVWLIAHLYEPLADDNSAGVVATVAVLKEINDLIHAGVMPAPECTIRAVFAMELHGFAAVSDRLGVKKVTGAVNMDGMPIRKVERGVKIFLAPPPLVAPGNAVMREVIAALAPLLTISTSVVDYGFFQDDAALADPSVGVPVIWPLHVDQSYWHNSAQTVDVISEEKLSEYIAFITCWAAGCASEQIADGDMLGRLYLEALEKIAAKPVSSRSETTMAHIRLSDTKGAEGRFAGSREEFEAKLGYAVEHFSAELESFGLLEEAEALKKRAAGLVEEYAPPPRREDASTVWFRLLKTVVPERLTKGLPYDLTRSKKWRPAMDTIYTPTGRVLAGSDGKKNLQQLAVEAEYQENMIFTEPQLKSIFNDLTLLEKLGYLRLRCENRITVEEFRAKLREVGVAPGDLLMVHAGLSNLGALAASPQQFNDVLAELLGAQGTLLMPAFTNPYAGFEDDMMQNCLFMRPYTGREAPRTGALARELLNRPGAERDCHTTHEVAGIGAEAAALLNGRAPLEPPTGPASVWGKLAARNGKILFIGTGLGRNTYLHFLETELDLWYLGGALIRYRTESGKIGTGWIKQHLNGCRDFYKGISAKFYRKALERGLHIHSVPLGAAQLELIDAAELYRIGRSLLQEDPELLLCDSETCLFCQNAKRRRKKLLS